MNNHRKGINNRFNLQICYNLKFRTLTHIIKQQPTIIIAISIAYLNQAFFIYIELGNSRLISTVEVQR